MKSLFLRAGVVVFLDQLTKFAIRRSFLPGQGQVVWPKVFHLSYVQNPGAAFGLLQNQTWLLVAVTIVIMVLIILYAGRTEFQTPLLRWSLSSVLGGAVGNLIDRVRFGYVIDFLDFRVWPVFNIADMAIVAGVGLLIVCLLRSGEKLV
ncbi:MAG TPA: signal peptidase II [bacterium]|nr:signal peptidase II [bacterium]